MADAELSGPRLHPSSSDGLCKGELLVRTNFRLGRKDYLLGRHPLWQLFRPAYQMRRRPVIVGGFMLLAGYLSLAVRRTKRPVADEVIRFQRREQMMRLQNFFARRFCRREFGLAPACVSRGAGSATRLSRPLIIGRASERRILSQIFERCLSSTLTIGAAGRPRQTRQWPALVPGGSLL